MREKNNLTFLISEKIREWYHNILSRRFEEAKKNKKAVELLIAQINDQRLKTFHTLILNKHNLTLHGHGDTSNIENNQNMTDDALKILIYDYAGQAAFYQNDYSTAIVQYQKAEKLLHVVEDQFEKADFLKRLGILFYRVDESLMASNYLNRAKEIFATNSFYKLNELSCLLVIAGIFSEMTHYDKAETLFEQILEESLFIPEMHFYTSRAYGLHCVRYKDFKKAEEIFSTLLCEKGTVQFSNVLEGKNKIDLANVLLKQKRIVEGSRLLNEGIKYLDEKNDIEYIGRIEILYHLYISFNLEKVEQQLDNLIKENLYFEASELALDVSYYFKQHRQYKQSLKYTEMAIKLKAKSKIILETGVSIA